jgi:hypothetical protein
VPPFFFYHRESALPFSWNGSLGRAFKLLAFGSGAGLLLGIQASRVLASIVYQASPRDPVVLAGIVLAGIPARRALAVNPLVLLREE